jgi:hypothetical protein
MSENRRVKHISGPDRSQFCAADHSFAAHFQMRVADRDS